MGFLKWFGLVLPDMVFDAADSPLALLCLLMPSSPFGVPAASQLVMHDTAVCCAVTLSRIHYNKMAWWCSASMVWPLLLM
jgi:hypothetical protein